MAKKKSVKKVAKTVAAQTKKAKAVVEEKAVEVKAAAEEVKAVVEEKAEEAKTTVAAKAVEAKAVVEEKAEETKAAAKEVKAAVEKKATKAVEAVGETAAKTVKKTAQKKAPVKRLKETVIVEYFGKQFNAADIKKKAQDAFKASHKGVKIATLEIYVKPEENAAYYVVNGEGSEDFKISLD